MVYLIYILAGMLVLAAGGLGLAAFRIQTNFFVNATNRVNTREKVVALTFDDGPHPHTTPQIISLLKKTGASATFFVIGQRAGHYPEIVKAIAENGCEVANHGYSHSVWFPFFTPQRMFAELEQTDLLIEAQTGKLPVFFRPPFGITNPRVARALRRYPKQVAGWSIRTLDTRADATPERILQRVRKGLRPGAIVLMHDDRTLTLETLPEVIKFLQTEGYTIVSLSKLLDYDQAP